jgi:hypothetical protein
LNKIEKDNFLTILKNYDIIIIENKETRSRSMIVSKKGWAAFEAAEAWAKYATEHDIKDPMNERLDIMNKYKKNLPGGGFSICLESEYSKEDQERLKELNNNKYAYMRSRDRFQVKWITEHMGWEIGHDYAVLWNNDWNDLLWYFEQYYCPCDFGECNIFCVDFESCCAKKGGFTPWN